MLPTDLLKPFPAEEMKSWRVGSAVGNVRNNSPELLLRLREHPAGLHQSDYLIPAHWPTPKEQIVFLSILSGQGQSHASGE
jgi:hypothetical protein